MFFLPTAVDINEAFILTAEGADGHGNARCRRGVQAY